MGEITRGNEMAEEKEEKKLIIDEDWKSQAQKRKGNRSPPRKPKRKRKEQKKAKIKHRRCRRPISPAL